MKHIDLFSGIGGFALAAQTVWGDEYENVLFCDNNKFCRQVIRKNFGKESVIYGDIREITRERVIADTRSDEQRRRGKEVNTAEAGQQTLNNAEKCSDGVTADTKRGRPYTEKDKQELESKGSNEFCVKQPGDIKFQRIDLLTGGFPCQPFSQAGKRKGTDDDRFLWPEMLRVIKEFKPTWIIGENVAGILSMAQYEGESEMASETDLFGNVTNTGSKRGVGILYGIIRELEQVGYSVQTFVIPAVAVNAPHRRDRVWIVANSESKRSGGFSGKKCGIQEREFQPREQKGSEIRSKSQGCVGNVADSEGRESGQQTERQGREDSGGGSEEGVDAPDTNSKRSGTQASGIDGNRKKENKGQGQQSFNRINGQDSNAPDSDHGNDARKYDKGERASTEISDADNIRSECRTWDENWLEVATELCGVDDGLPVELDGFKLTKAGHRVERLKALGNAIVPQVAIEIMRGIKAADQGRLF